MLRKTAVSLFRADHQSTRIVPPSGFAAWLTVFAAGAMAFLSVFALSLALAAGGLAARWSAELADSATVRIIAPQGQVGAQIEATLRVLETTPGVQSARTLSDAEHEALLAPWFGSDTDLSALPIPRLIDVRTESGGFDATGLRLRLAAEAPAAVLDDHGRWRAPLAQAATRLRALAWVSIALIAATTAVIVTLAASASLAANAQVIGVLRLVGATDAYIADAFVRRFGLRAIIGATAGVLFAVMCLFLLPSPQENAGILTGLRLSGWHWLLPFCVPPLAGVVAYVATRNAAKRTLSELT